jgi:hypothetical protein
MSELKINYHKSEVMIIGASKEESSRIANVLNCKDGTLPMKYLGIPVSNMKLYTSYLAYVGVKVEKKAACLERATPIFGWEVNFDIEQSEFSSNLHNGCVYAV